MVAAELLFGLVVMVEDACQRLESQLDGIVEPHMGWIDVVSCLLRFDQSFQSHLVVVITVVVVAESPFRFNTSLLLLL